MIKRIQISGFKCFEQVELNFSNFTLLAGQNSKGKTTVIQAIFAMLQNGQNPFRGEYMNIGNASELENAIIGSREINFNMQIEKNGDIEESTKTIRKKQVNCVNTENLRNDIKVIYCSADRIGVKDTYEKYLGDEIIIGRNCEYVFHYLSKHDEDKMTVENNFIYDTASKLNFAGQVDYWLNRIIGYRVKAQEIDKTEFIRVLYSNDKMTFEMRPKNVGTGVTYIAEIVIAALACRAGDLLIIENPEIHLHPSGQAELIHFLAFLAQCGVQIIVETHSDHIYNGIRKSISLDEIDNEKVSIYFFKHDEKGCSVPVNIPIDDTGKALEYSDGLFDQIKKDLDVICTIVKGVDTFFKENI